MNRRASAVVSSHAVSDPLLADHAAKIRKNGLLFAIYEDIYRRQLDEIPAARFPRTLEIGSGAGFLKHVAPHVTTSDCIPGDGIERVVDACRLGDALERGSLDAIVAMNVFHHLPDVVGFLRGAEHALRPGGRVVLVEPWFTPVGQWFYRLLHHEPVISDPNAWRIDGAGRLDGANSRLPTSVFRDGRQRLAETVPGLAVSKVLPFHKWLYLLSGGLRLNTHVPRAVGHALLYLDRISAPLDPALGLFALIVLERRPHGAL
jgi:SAM-dependent methyltransferase